RGGLRRGAGGSPAIPKSAREYSAAFFLPGAESGTIHGRPPGTAAMPPLDLLYEDNHCIAVNKPPGIASTHYEGRHETVDRAVKEYLKAKYKKPGNVFLGIVHRLDKPTSGVLLRSEEHTSELQS